MNKLINLEFIISSVLKIKIFSFKLNKIFLKKKDAQDVKKRYIMNKINIINYIKIIVVKNVIKIYNKKYEIKLYVFFLYILNFIFIKI